MSNYRLKPDKYSLIILLTVIFLSGCSAVKKIKDSDHLLNKNIIKTDRPELREQASAIIKQKPNKRILGLFRFHLGIYNLANTGKETRFKRWVKRTIGEEPVLLDTMLTEKSQVQLKIFMQNKGYFNASVSDTVIYKPRKKANVLYEIKSGDAYLFRNLHYQIADTTVERIVLADSINTLIKYGNNYDAGIIQKERERINTVMKNRGFYFFNQQYISFSVDTNLQSNQADVYLLISSQINALQSDTVTLKTGLPFLPYTIRKVYVQTDYDPIGKHDLIPNDTIVSGNYYFLYSTPKLHYKPSLLLRHVFIKQDYIFRQSDVEDTYRHLQDLNNFRFINIKYSLVKDAPTDQNLLDCELLLTPAASQDYKVEVEGTYSGGNYGIPINLSYRNKNIFRGSELLEIKLKGGLEKQIAIADTTLETQTNLPFFNAYEIGPEISLAIPRFLFPFPVSKDYVYANPSTNISTAYNYQQRLEYKRTLTNLSFSYSWKQNSRIRHFVYPAEINFLKVDLQPAFEKKLKDLGDPSLEKSYRDQLITNGRYTFIFNNQDLSKPRSHTYFKLNLEFAGNTIWLANKLQNNKPEQKDSILFGVPYANYFRPDFDIRYYQLFNRSSQLVYRVAAGLGLAYGNSTVMPFEKSFYSGGSNDMRAWRGRQLGPGTYSDDQRFEKSGEIKLNGNVEYRFDIFRKFKGAVFVDAGNIWLVKPDEKNKPGAGFNSSTFVSEIAIGGGIGLRFDFTFFILRLDAAQKLKDPSKNPGERWVVSKNKIKGDTLINFGIGYPF